MFNYIPVVRVGRMKWTIINVCRHMQTSTHRWIDSAGVIRNVSDWSDWTTSLIQSSLGKVSDGRQLAGLKRQWFDYVSKTIGKFVSFWLTSVSEVWDVTLPSCNFNRFRHMLLLLVIDHFHITYFFRTLLRICGCVLVGWLDSYDSLFTWTFSKWEIFGLYKNQKN